MNRIQSSSRNMMMGLFLILLGVAGVLNNLDYFNIGPIWNLWPAIFLFIGIGKLVSPDTPEERSSAAFWICMSLYFFASIYHLYGMNYHNGWPILLIGIGISMAWKSLIRSSSFDEPKEA